LIQNCSSFQYCLRGRSSRKGRGRAKRGPKIVVYLYICICLYSSGAIQSESERERAREVFLVWLRVPICMTLSWYAPGSKQVGGVGVVDRLSHAVSDPGGGCLCASWRELFVLSGLFRVLGSAWRSVQNIASQSDCNLLRSEAPAPPGAPFDRPRRYRVALGKPACACTDCMLRRFSSTFHTQDNRLECTCITQLNRLFGNSAMYISATPGCAPEGGHRRYLFILGRLHSHQSE
jgi:hypothetical protein